MTVACSLDAWQCIWPSWGALRAQKPLTGSGYGAIWCSMVRGRKKPQGQQLKRFSVSVRPSVYEALLAIADGCSPPLSLQYVVNYALLRLVEEAKAHGRVAGLGDPLNGERTP